MVKSTESKETLNSNIMPQTFINLTKRKHLLEMKRPFIKAQLLEETKSRLISKKTL